MAFPWADDEGGLLRKCFVAGMTDEAIGEKLREAGYDRSDSAVRTFRKRNGLTRERPLRKLPAITSDDTSYWRHQQDADDKFQAAMLAAGMQSYVDKRPCTENPKMMRAEPELRSRNGYVLPAEGGWGR